MMLFSPSIDAVGCFPGIHLDLVESWGGREHATCREVLCESEVPPSVHGNRIAINSKPWSSSDISWLFHALTSFHGQPGPSTPMTARKFVKQFV
jgi:hypothetical protein